MRLPWCAHMHMPAVISPRNERGRGAIDRVGARLIERCVARHQLQLFTLVMLIINSSPTASTPEADMGRPAGAGGVNLETRETDPPRSAQSTDLAHRLQEFDNVMQWLISDQSHHRGCRGPWTT
jgi:hypothetical protein